MHIQYLYLHLRAFTFHQSTNKPQKNGIGHGTRP